MDNAGDLIRRRAGLADHLSAPLNADNDALAREAIDAIRTAAQALDPTVTYAGNALEDMFPRPSAHGSRSVYKVAKHANRRPRARK